MHHRHQQISLLYIFQNWLQMSPDPLIMPQIGSPVWYTPHLCELWLVFCFFQNGTLVLQCPICSHNFLNSPYGPQPHFHTVSHSKFYTLLLDVTSCTGALRELQFFFIYSEVAGVKCVNELSPSTVFSLSHCCQWISLGSLGKAISISL